MPPVFGPQVESPSAEQFVIRHYRIEKTPACSGFLYAVSINNCWVSGTVRPLDLAQGRTLSQPKAGRRAQREFNPVLGTLETRMPPKEEVAFSLPVPGTDPDDVANNSVVENWWILKEM